MKLKKGDKVWTPWLSGYKKGRVIFVGDDFVLVKVGGFAGLGVWREALSAVVPR